jgi:hypothetical protein
MSYTPGQILTAAALNASLDAKTDNAAANITGGSVTGLTSFNVSGTTPTTSPTTGAATVAGGVGVGGDVQVGGAVVVSGTTDSTSTTTGAVKVAGGVGVVKNVNVGGNVGVTGTTTTGSAAVTATTQSTSATTGAATVAGGLGVSKNANVGGALGVTGVATVGGLTLSAGGILTFADGTTQATSGTSGVLLKANNLSDVASIPTARSNLGLGTAATQNTGTSGATVPLLNGANTWAALQTMSVRPVFNGNTPYDTGNVNPFSLLSDNRIINGGCRVQQRVSIVATNNVNGYGGPDRFRVSNSAAGGTVTQSASTITFGGIVKPAVLQTATAAATSITGTNFWSGFNYRIEGYDVYDLVGQPVAISFIFQASIAGTYAVALIDAASAFTYLTTITVAAANTPQLFTISVPAIPAGATIPCNNTTGLVVWIGAQNSGTFSGTASAAWQAGNFIATTGTVPWSATVGATIAMTELKLEGGSISTPFKHRPIETEVALCQRYFSSNSYRVDVFLSSAGTIASTTITFPRTMRGIPSSTVVNAVYSGSASAATFNSLQASSAAGVAITYTAQTTVGSVTATLQNSVEL